MYVVCLLVYVSLGALESHCDSTRRDTATVTRRVLTAGVLCVVTSR